LNARLGEISALVAAPDIWSDRERAEKLFQEKSEIEKKLGLLERAEGDLAALAELAEMAPEDKEVEAELVALAARLEAERLDLMLSGPADANGAYLEIHAGAGGTEAQDWAQMLLRMYQRWAEKHGHKVFLIDQHDGEEAGIKSATIEISGRNVYGWLKSESGIHRLVRISPFDSSARRHTSFASVWVYPIVDDKIEIDINPADLRIDTFRASGAGGQHVNKTDSAVRITHIPSGVAVQCQNERSQFKNKDMAMSMLRSRLYNLELEKRQAEKDAAEATKSEIGWGSQIRSYVMQPYQMAKDLRTGHETSNIAAVLDGEIDGFLSASLLAGNKNN
jgi:peptide chain release factor 2